MIDKGLKKVDIVAHGNYVFAKLDSVDFTASGTMVSEQTGLKTEYGASLKLKLLIEATRLKNLNGTDIEIKSTVSQTVKISTIDEQLPKLLAKYESLRGKDILVHYFAADNFTFKVLNEDSIREVK